MKSYIRIGLFFLAFSALTVAGNFFIFLPYSSQSVFLPATGLSVAMLLLTDYKKWTPYLICIFIASIAISYFYKQELLFCLVGSLLTTLEAMTVAFLVKKIIGPDFSLDRIKDFSVLIITGAFFIPAVFSLLSTYVNMHWYTESSFWVSYLSFGAGKGIGVLVFAPFVLAWHKVSLPWISLRMWGEFLTVLVLITVFSFMVFVRNYVNKSFGFDMEMFFFIFPLIFWMGFRFGLYGITAASVIVNSIAIYYSTYNLGPFALYGTMPLEDIFHLESFLSFLTLSPLVIALVRGERRSGKQQLQEIIDNSPILFFAKSLEGKYIFANKKFEEFFNISGGNVIGKTDDELFPKEQADSLIENPKQQDKYEPYTYEKIISKGNEQHTFIITVFPLQYEKGKVYAVCSCATDITEFREVESRFKMVVNSAPNTMILVDTTGKIIMVNPMTVNVFGYKEDELIGKPIEILVPQPSRSKHPALVKGYFDKPVARPLGAGRDLYGIRKDGSEVPVEISLSPIKTDKGMFALASVIDITIRKQTSEALRLSERRFSYVLAATQDSIYDWEMDKGKLWRNDEYEKLFDGPTANTDPDWWSKKIHPEDFEKVNSSLQEIYKNHEQIWNQEFRFKKVDGGYADVIDRGFIIYDGAGKPIRMIGAIMDITERKKADLIIHQSEERFRMFSELSSEAIVIHDHGKIVEVNDALKKMFGYEEAELIGNSVLMLAAPESAELIKKNMTLDFGHPYEAVGIKKDGGVFYGEIKRRDINYKGKILRLVTIHDVSERKKAEEVEKKRIAKIFERQGELLKLTSFETDLTLQQKTSTLQQKLKKIVEADAKTTEVERVSICFFNKTNADLETEFIYLLSKNEYAEGFTFKKKEYPRFHQEISFNKIIDANDAQNDPRTSELLSDYLLPNGISSLLIAPFTRNGKVMGVITHGHTGSKRIWTYDELYFVSSLSSIVSLAIEKDEQEKATKELKNLNETLESRIKERTDELVDIIGKFKGVTETAQDAIIYINSTGRITFWNKAAEKIFGYAENEAMGKDLSIIISPADFEKHTEGIKQFISTGEAKMIGKGAIELTAIKKGGEKIPVELSLQANTENGNVFFTGILRDISRRKKLQDEQDILFKMSVDMICIAGTDGFFKRINPAFEKTLGYTEEEFLSKPFMDFVHPDDKEATSKEIEKLAKGIPTNSFIDRFRTKNGEYKWLEWNATPVGDTLFAVARDITARKEAEQLVKKQEEEMKLAK